MTRWLAAQGVTHVAMEATGVYTMPVYHALAEPGAFDQVLVCNAAHVKNVPGRKTDPLTELPRGVQQLGGRMRIWVATVADRDHRRGCAAGSVAAGGAAARVA
jgi:transposase